jgi:hypothetical protein
LRAAQPATVAGGPPSSWARSGRTPCSAGDGEYEISDLGRSLGPLFASLATWSAGHLDAVEQARRAYDAAR